MPKKKDVSNPDFVRLYYEHQYDRMKALEEQRLTITNIVISLSVVAFTFGFQNLNDITIINGIGLPVLIIVLNLFAALYIWRTLQYIRVHRHRAKIVLGRYSKEMIEIDSEHKMPHVFLRLGLAKIQLIIHIVLLIPSSIPIVAYFASIK